MRTRVTLDINVNGQIMCADHVQVQIYMFGET